MIGALIYLGVVLAGAVAIGVTWAVRDRRGMNGGFDCDCHEVEEWRL